MPGSQFMSRRSFVVLAGAVALTGLVGCGAGGGDEVASPEPGQDSASILPEAEDPKPVEIIESGYSVSGTGYVYYGVIWKNPNNENAIDFPTLLITGKAEDGSIAFSDEQVMGTILPGEEQCFGAQAGNGTAPATVEFAISPGKAMYRKTDERPRQYFKFSNGSEVVGDFNVSYTGEMTSNVDLGDVGQAWVTVLIRDSEGKICYAQNTFVDVPAVGQSIPFEVNMYGDVPEHASFEFFGFPWF